MASLFRKVTSTVSAIAVAATAVGSTLTVSAASEFASYADALASAGIINSQTTEAGYRLGDNITRAEMAKIAVKLNGAEVTTATNSVFSDVTSAKLGDLADYIETAANAGIVSKANAKFRPMDLVTRAEMVKMLMAAKGVATTNVSAGFADVGASLGDLAGYINAAAAEGYISMGTSFRPNATASRGEAFKVAAGVAGVAQDNGDIDLGDLFGTGSTNNGSSTGSTTTPTTPVAAGDLNVALAASSPAAGSIPQVATVPFGKFDLSAGGSDITVRTLTVKRDGLGNRTDITNLWLEMNGVRVSTKASVSSDDTAVVSFSPALVVKAGSTASVSLIVQLNASSAASQHRFGVVAASSVDSSAANVKGSFPVYTATLTTANYTVSSVSVTPTPVTGSVRVGDTSVVLGDMTLSLGNQNRDVTVAALTLYNSGTLDLAKSASNVALYNKATGAKVSTATTVNGRYVTFTLNDTVAYTAGTRSYQVKGDVVSVDRDGDSVNLSFDSKTENLTVNEATTGYRATVSYSETVGNLGAKTVTAGDVSIVQDTSVSSTTVAKNTTSVLLLAGTVKVQQPITIENITVNFTGGTTNFGSGFTRVKLVVGGTSMTADAANSVVFQNTYAISADTPIKVYGDVRYDAVAAVYSASSLTVDSTKVRYQATDRVVSTITNAFSSANGVTATVATPTVTVTNNGAVASSSTVAGAKNVVLGKFSLVNNNLSDITVSNLAFKVSGSTTVANSFLTNTTVDLYVNGTVKESRQVNQIVSSASGVTFGSTSFTLAKGATVNLELSTTALPTSYGTGALQLQYASATMTDNVGQSATVSGAPTGTLYTVLSAGTVTFGVSSSNSAKILTASTSAQEIGRFTVNATNDDVKLLDLYLSATGLTDASAVISNPAIYDGNGNLIANGSIIGGVLKFSSINSGNGHVITKGTTTDLVVKAVVLESTSATASGTVLAIALGASNTGAIDSSISANVVSNVARIMSVATSGYLSSVTTTTASAATNLVTNSKPVFAASAGQSNDEHRITVTVDAGGKILLTGLTGTFNTGTMTGTLYLGTVVSSANAVATLSGGTFTFTGAKAVAGNGGTYGAELAAGSTNTFLLKLSGITSSTNANSIRTLTVTDAQFQDYVGTTNSYTPAITSISGYNNVGLSVSSSTTY